MSDGYPKNFRPEEFYCKCGECSGVPPDKSATRHLAWVLQQIRDLANVPIKITSGYRCPTHNERVGGISFGRGAYPRAVLDYTIHSCIMTSAQRRRGGDA